MKINGWKRIGIIASVVWIFWSYNHQMDAETQRYTALAVDIEMTCEQTHQQAGETFDQFFPICDALGKTNGGEQRAFANYRLAEKEAAGFAAITTLFAWLGVYLAIFLVRWVKRGFTGARP